MSYQIQLKRDSAANWTSNDPTLAEGEFGFETDTGRLKLGDGSTAWSSLEWGFTIDSVTDGFKVQFSVTNWVGVFENDTGGAFCALAHGAGYGAFIDAGSLASSGTYALNVLTGGDGGAGGTSRFYIGGDGKTGVGETSPDAQFTINQGADDTSILTLKSSDVSHGGVQSLESDTFVQMAKVDAGGGGLLLRAILDGDETPHVALHMQGFSRDALDTTKSTAGIACVMISAFEHDGAGTTSDVTADSNVFGVRCKKGGATATVFIIDEDGDYHYDGADGGAFDNEEDLKLITAMSPNWEGKVAERYRDRLIELGIMSEGGFISGKKSFYLTVGCFEQIVQRLEEQEERILQLEVA